MSHHCSAFTLPSNGVISLADSAITLTTDVVFQPECTGTGEQEVSSITNLKDPFYASTIPQTYVIAAATVIAWILVLMLIITPRTNFLGHSGATPGFSNGHGIIGGATGGNTRLIGIGSRPWLQKVAALTVAVSLTIATADTFQAAQRQYIIGFMDATALRDEVLGSLEIRITRVISDVFVWLAQVQTLIRLFPRHKEKVLIKWIGFALILFDSIFSCLNSFLVDNQHQPRHFVDAIPALSYLFELALGLLYAAWVIYYSVTKRRYAYYHHKMRSIGLIAILSLIAILTPVVFFVTDVSNEDVAGWGDYFRWVGAAAASVVVWEWVERIEALERDEKKDGILGREIFDGDEMLDVTPSEEVVWAHGRSSRNHTRKNDRDDDGGAAIANESSALEHGLNNMAQRFRNRQHRTQQHFPLGRAHSHTTGATAISNNVPNGSNTITFGNLPKPRQPDGDILLGAPTPPPVAASPVSRADTASAASTVYVVHYHTPADVPQPIRRRVDPNGNTEHTLAQAQAQAQRQRMQVDRRPVSKDLEEEEVNDSQPIHDRRTNAWLSVANPFKRKRASPPSEVQQARQAAATAVATNTTRAVTPAHNFSRWDFKGRLGVLAAETGDKFRDRTSGRRQHDELPVTIIPAQPRGSGRTWTPANATSENVVRTALSARNRDDSAGVHHSSDSTTDTADNNAAAPIPRHSSGQTPADNLRPSGVGVASVPNATYQSSRSPHLPPPRADDISPVAGSRALIVIPAPRRSNGSSPLATQHVSASSSRESAGNVTHSNT